MQRMHVQSLVGELRSHMLHVQKIKKFKNRKEILTSTVCVPGTIVLDTEDTSMNQIDRSSFPLVNFTFSLRRQTLSM